MKELILFKRFKIVIGDPSLAPLFETVIFEMEDRYELLLESLVKARGRFSTPVLVTMNKLVNETLRDYTGAVMASDYESQSLNVDFTISYSNSAESKSASIVSEKGMLRRIS